MKQQMGTTRGRCGEAAGPGAQEHPIFPLPISPGRARRLVPAFPGRGPGCVLTANSGARSGTCRENKGQHATGRRGLGSPGPPPCRQTRGRRAGRKRRDWTPNLSPRCARLGGSSRCLEGRGY